MGDDTTLYGDDSEQLKSEALPRARGNPGPADQESSA